MKDFYDKLLLYLLADILKTSTTTKYNKIAINNN